MRKVFLNTSYLLLCIVGICFISSCEDHLSDSKKDKWASLVNETHYEPVIEGNTISYGSHFYTVNGEITDEVVAGRRDTPTAWVTFTNIPSGYAEFKDIYNGLLGKSIQGTAAMIPMAIEIYARDAATGEECFKLLCNSQSTVDGILRILKDRFTPREESGADDSYVQRYMAAALLKDATPQNAYTPSEPYTVEMCASANKPQKVTGGTNTFVYILCKGWDTDIYEYAQRQVEIFQANGSNLYKVYNCPSTYTHCQDIIGDWIGLK